MKPVMYLQVPIQGTTLYTEVLIESFDDATWTGAVDGIGGQYFWGVILSAPWISLECVSGRIQVELLEPQWSNEFVSAYPIDETSCKFVLKMFLTSHLFDSLADLIEFAFDNLRSYTQFHITTVPFGLLYPKLVDRVFTVEHFYELGGLVIQRETVKCMLGWLSPRSKKTLSGKPRSYEDRRSGKAEWTVEALESSYAEDIVDSILWKLTEGSEWSDDCDELPCYDWDYEPRFVVREPYSSDIFYHKSPHVRYHLKPRDDSGSVQDVYLGLFLNAPVALFEGESTREFIVYPTYTDIYKLVEGNQAFADEIQEVLYEMFLQEDKL